MPPLAYYYLLHLLHHTPPIRAIIFRDIALSVYKYNADCHAVFDTVLQFECNCKVFAVSLGSWLDLEEFLIIF